MFNLFPVGETCLKGKTDGLIPLAKQDIRLNACIVGLLVLYGVRNLPDRHNHTDLLILEQL